MDHAKYHVKPLMNTPVVLTPDTTIEIDGESIPAEVGEPLIEAINRTTAAHRREPLPQVCYLKPMGAIGSCDTCMVELNGSARPRVRVPRRARPNRAHALRPR